MALAWKWSAWDAGRGSGAQGTLQPLTCFPTLQRPPLFEGCQTSLCPERRRSDKVGTALGYGWLYLGTCDLLLFTWVLLSVCQGLLRLARWT